MPHDLSPEAQSIELDLDDEATRKDAIHNLSGAVFIGESLYLANDEGKRLLQLRRDSPRSRRYRLHDKYAVTKLFQFRDGEIDNDSEFDLEALAVDERHRLWLIGSHAMGHEAPPGSTNKRLGLKRDRSRLLLACIDTEGGEMRKQTGRHFEIKRVRDTYTTELLSALRAAPPPAQGFLREASALEHLEIPGEVAKGIGWFTPYTLASTKENGLDVEGLAIRHRDANASEATAFIGLRGPVIDGLAVIVEIDIDRRGENGLKLAAGPRFHLVDLHGFGVRDLEWRDDDLLILAGPTMKRQGESALYRWPGARRMKGPERIPDVVEVDGVDFIGALPMWPDGGGPEVITSTGPRTDELMLLRDGITGGRLVDHNGQRSVDGPIYHAEVYRAPD